MLTVVSGSFNPGLEQAFVEHLKHLKKMPLAPVAVVVPSSRMLDRLEILLSGEGLSLLNVHFHTLASFAESAVLAETELEKPLLSDPLFFDTLVKIIIKEDKPFEGLSDVAVPEGFPPAVRSTLRDLLDAGIDEQNVMEAIHEEFAGRDVDLGTLRSLLRLHHLYLKRLKTLPISSRAELLKNAIERAPESKWIGQFLEVLFYGFYDMTGNQVDFFHAVVKNHPSRFFFPYLKDHPAYAFAKRFRDNFVQPVMQEEFVVARTPVKTDRRIVNVSGLRDEAWFVASEINRLHQEENIPFSRIGVIARTQSRLSGALPKTLEACDVPYRSAAKESFFDLPAVQAVFEALSLLDGETVGKWSEHVKRTIDQIETQNKGSSLAATRLDPLFRGVEDMAKFDLLSSHVSRREFLETLRDRWSRMDRVDAGQSEAGVSLLYAEAARGIPFDVLFLLGVEERVFPRVIREDPFLRDDTRLALNLTLGHKIGQKMTALEEERLLFELFTHAESQKLILTYQRSDDDGSVVGPSTFLRAFAEENKLSLEKDVVSIPRPALAKIAAAKPTALSRQDIVTGFLSAGREQEALQFAKNDARSTEDLKRGLAVQKILHSFDNPGPYDGLIGKQDPAFLFRGGKISPTALELYGQCPFKYFATRILQIEPKEDGLVLEALPADVRGTLSHDFLEKFFKQVTSDGARKLPERFPESTFDQVFEGVIGKISSKEINLHPVFWQAAKTNLKEKLRSSVESDYQECLASGFNPTFFEAEETTALKDFSQDLIWLGKMDRIDMAETQARVVDYKTGRAPDQKKVAPAAIQGTKSQAPLYLLLAKNLLERLKKDVSQISFVYLYLFDGPEARVFSSEDWDAFRGAIVQTIRKQVALIHEGNFLMLPDDATCSYCEVKPICRINHGLSTYRARKGEGTKLWEIREQKWKVKKS